MLDYGCGRGGDIRHLRSLGYPADGWDPVFSPDGPREPSDVVNLGYVVNVIEDPAERRETLREAWRLTNQVLVVAARPDWEARGLAGAVRHGDGVLTGTGTFQRFFRQEELRAWIDQTLGTTSVAAAPGVFYVFRQPDRQQGFLARRTRSRAAETGVRLADLLFEQHRELLEPLRSWVEKNRRLPKPGEYEDEHQLSVQFGSVRAAFSFLRRATGPKSWSDVDLGPRNKVSERRFTQNRQLLDPLIDFVSQRGRLPREEELLNTVELAEEFGSVRAAFSLIRRVTGSSQWSEVEERSQREFLIYLALAAFGGRPRFTDLPDDLQYDVRDLFGNYKTACQRADELLFKAGNRGEVDLACRTAETGKLTPEALYIHSSAIDQLPPILRVYEGCGRTLTGQVEGSTILKLHREKAQVSYLAYPTFDKDAHPALATVVIARLSQLDVSFKDFRHSLNPPILHRKETFVPAEYPGRDRFLRLTLQEERRGLLDDASGIGTRRAWEERLGQAGVRIQGHRVISR